MNANSAFQNDLAARRATLAARLAGSPPGGAAAPSSDVRGAASGRGFRTAFPAASPATAGGTRRALLVAVDRTLLPGYDSLHGCKPDAKNLASACTELGGWLPENVRILADADATVGNVRTALASLAEIAEPGDVVLYAQSGHGDRDPSRPPGNDACLALRDAEYWEADFRSDLLRFRAGVKLVVLIDTCHSAGMFEKDPDRAAVPVSRSIFSPARFAADSAVSRRGGIRESEIGWIAASSKDQVSDDLGNGGYFTTTLVDEGWRKGGAVGFEDSIAGLSDEVARRTMFARPSAGATAATGTVTFLDLALYVAQSWRYFHPSEQQPRFHNPDLLRSVVAGRAGVR